MAFRFTEKQQEVIDLRGCNVLVSAAAGSGKTAVLVERIIEMVCDETHPVDIDRLLIVTFTNAAAAEMRERIAAGISDRLQKNPECGHIQRQSALLHNALITTIDSFSLFLIRNHFNEIGLDPAFRVADEGEIKLLGQDVLKELLEEAYWEQKPEFIACVEHFCPGGKEKALEQHILNLSRYADSFPWPEEWLQERKKDYGAADFKELEESECGCYLKRHIERMVKGCMEKMGLAGEICDSPDGPYMYGETVERERELLEKLSGCDSLEAYGEMLPAVSFGRLPVKKDESVSVKKREMVKTIRSEVKNTIQDLAETFFATPLSLAAEQGQACAGPVSALIDLTLDFDRRMQEKKREKKLIDFSDMEHYALDILLKREKGQVYPSPVAFQYREYFQEILTDEYQDSNLVQEYLLRAVSGEDEGHFNRFMVGDVKQSIYKFRLARPELFLEKYQSYRADGKEKRRIDLSKNFRSRNQVVMTVNHIFSRIMSEEVGGIAYDDAAALQAGAAYPENDGCLSELLLVEKPRKEDGVDAKEAEALAVAAKIKSLRASFCVTDKESGELRPVRYGDMVILLRTNSGWDEVFKRVLETEGIPAYVTSKTGYFAASEVQELLQVLRVLDNPRQDIPLFCVMKSVFGGFAEEEIARIRSFCKRGTLYEALLAYEKGQEENPLSMRASAFLKAIEHYRSLTACMPIRELLQRITEDFDYLNYVTALPGGSRRHANVEMLFTKASDFEKSSYFGLFHFIRYMEQLEKYDVDYGEAGILDENADVVRIMSIHKSKGLEFPVTFVAGLSKRFNMQDASQSLVLDMDMGIAVDYVDPNRRLRNKTLRRMVLSRKMREDNLAEELRILYVAMTRAKEKLILTGVLEHAEEKWEQHRQLPEEKLFFLDFMEAGSYLDFLLPVLPEDSVKVSVVTTEELLGSRVKEQFALMADRERLKQAGHLADQEALSKLRERFAYRYPCGALSGLYTKTTVSELKIAAMAEADEAAFHTFEEEEVVPYVPAFRRGKEKVSGAVRGSAFHRVMELLDFERLLGEQFETFPETYETFRQGISEETLREALHAFLCEEKESLRLSEEYFGAVREEKLVRFLGSSLSYRMWRADRCGVLYREQPFVYGISAVRLSKDFPPEETVLIQGIIDVFFEEQGELVLLDYKTDVVDSPEDLWNRYETQLDYYEEALRKLTEKPVKEKALYSFYLETASFRQGG